MLSVADLEGVRGLTPPGQFFLFHAVLGENWPDNMLALPLCSRLICEMLNPPLTIVVIFFLHIFFLYHFLLKIVCISINLTNDFDISHML